jgi:hypothetical protein
MTLTDNFPTFPLIREDLDAHQRRHTTILAVLTRTWSYAIIDEHYLRPLCSRYLSIWERLL